MRRLKTIIEAMYSNNDGSRPLLESVVSNEVQSALTDWVKNSKDSVLIGGIVVSYYLKPRATMDIDALFRSESAIPSAIKGFKRTRDHAFQHNKTHVEVEILTPEFLKHIPQATINQIFATAVDAQGQKIASKSGLVASKLFRANYRDKDDILNLIKSGGVDVSSFDLPPPQLELFNQLSQEAHT